MRIPPVPSASRLFDQAAALTPGQACLAINDRLEEIVRGFPNFDKLDPFTVAMTRTMIDRDDVKKALGRIHGTQRMFARMTHLKKGEFLGRLKSILGKLDKSFETLRAARTVLQRLPDPTVHFTVCLAGFPNAGKSTMLKALTGAKAEIAAYEFTTKTLNYGTTDIGFLPVQFVDTPGTLNRAKANPIEQQAFLALSHLATAIVFVYDPFRPAEEQEQLFETLFVYKLPMAIYASKQDIYPSLPLFAKATKLKIPVFTKASEITAWVEPMLRKKLVKPVEQGVNNELVPRTPRPPKKKRKRTKKTV